MSQHETYLGDGLYASFDGFIIKLRAPREGGDHWVGLEPDVFAALVEYQKQVTTKENDERHRRKNSPPFQAQKSTCPGRCGAGVFSLGPWPSRGGWRRCIISHRPGGVVAAGIEGRGRGPEGSGTHRS